MPRVQRCLAKLGRNRIGQTLRMYFIPSAISQPNLFRPVRLQSRMRYSAVVLGLVAVLTPVTHGQSPTYSALGCLVEVGGRKLHINRTWAWSPTVVLEGFSPSV